MLDAILAVGYRVNSSQATQFRIWATGTLKEFIIKGFVMDDERLKQGKNFGKDYFDELLERIREIRASERRFYQKITDIYALSIDYNKDSDTTNHFFAATKQIALGHNRQNRRRNNLHRSRCHQIVYGLKNLESRTGWKILKTDVVIAKNYLYEQHINELNRIVSAYLDLAENNAQRGIVTNMEGWAKFLGNFLQLSNYPILIDKGKISMLEAKLKAEMEFDKYRVIQDRQYESDFDKRNKRTKRESVTISIKQQQLGKTL